MNDLSALIREFGDLSRYQQCPPFWIPTPKEALPFIRSLQQAHVRRIGRSAGGRDIPAIEYGPKEPVHATTDNLASALAARIPDVDPTRIYPAAFYGSRRRRRPVVAFQGAIHGGELTGTVASLNLCRIIEEGCDLRGKAWPRLQEMARETRILIIPWMNPDGTARWPIPNSANAPKDLLERCTQGLAADGTKFKYPESKSIFPVPPDKTAFMGSYFNDNGVNLQYDFTTVERQPETTAWMRYYLEERPDAVVIWHGNAGSMIGPPESFLPEGHQHEISRIGGAVRQRLLREGYPVGRISWAGLVGLGTHVLNQMNAVYHVAGALPIMCELPEGTEYQPYTCDQMLDVGLITIEEILFYAHHDGLRPYETWTKVKKSLPPDDPA